MNTSDLVAQAVLALLSAGIGAAIHYAASKKAPAPAAPVAPAVPILANHPLLAQILQEAEAKLQQQMQGWLAAQAGQLFSQPVSTAVQAAPVPNVK